MKNLFWILFAFVLLAGTSCQEKTDRKSDEEALRDYMDRYVACINDGDFEIFESFWAEDVLFMPPDAPIIKGKEAILDLARPHFTQYTMEYSLTMDEVKVIESFAFIRCETYEKLTPIDNNTEPVEINLKGIFILTKESNSSWVTTHMIWNSNSPSSQ